ncbi:HalOD1 domain-containing protein [Haloarcula virus HCTV-8]|uniref:HalOD1 domain-containing protein n=3 Tax=Haloferacalesvirus hv5 TaxID=1273753 RepID=A0AAE9BW65_9CAUD|nr:HalOD1 domain-containing protein [Haloarcula phage HCTV-7]UBF20442.1 HalOD1 domain-containing protein [Haloarcula phage HCTV-9]UBF20558.1 HalOD1 domain-containing protein [Haloarcula phage HCTV-11]UBF20900.1 HalOD1 domain-containing protein [Haloarcula virus HCTV-8]UBF21012.1 HalOD1 domain-containing protein [Haloarcula virus HCTV-10]
MVDPVHSHHVAVDEEHDLLLRGAHDSRGPGSLSVSVVKELSTLLDVDPISTPLNLDKYIDSDWLDQLPNRGAEHGENNIGVAFHYGDYKVFCCSCGKIAVYGDLAKHKRGEMKTPASMRSPTPDPTEVVVPDHSRTPRPTTPEKPDKLSPEKGELP